MRQLARSRWLAAWLCACWLHAALPVASFAQAAQADTTAAADVGPQLDDARGLIRNGDYDGAIERLRAVVDAAPRSAEDLRSAYLMLIKAYVFLGNDFRFKPQGREASSLNYEKARGLIGECLGVKALRHTQPEPASEYPPEMIGFFSEVRGQMFGSFRVVELDPSDAVVLFDGDTLRTIVQTMPDTLEATPNVGDLGDVDLAIGPHVVTVSAEGYKDLTDEITISPNATLERAYHLTRKRSATWYASVATGAAGLVTALALLVSGNGSSETPPEPLPEPPGPPN